MLNTSHLQGPAGLLKALSHPVRLAIVNALRDEEACVCHLEVLLGLRQAYLSQQLMSLREAGLLADRRIGSNVYYRVSEGRARALLDTLGIPPETLPVPLAACTCPRCQAARAQAVSNVSFKETSHA